MATLTATYHYCDGYSYSSVTVTMNNPTCPTTGAFYDDNNGCTYRTYRKNVTFTLSHSVPVDLYVRFRVTFTQEKDNSGVISTGIQTYTAKIPAGRTFLDYSEVNGGYDFMCKEERWCSFGTGTYIPTTV